MCIIGCILSKYFLCFFVVANEPKIDIHNILFIQALPLLKNKRKYTSMVDPLLKGNYPMRGLFQALAIAAMCLLEDANARPLIGDVVTALEVLAMRHVQVGKQKHTKETSIEKGECS